MASEPKDGRPHVTTDTAAYPPPAGTEHAMIEAAAARTIAEMEAEGGRPLGMMRMLHDDEWEDMLFVYGPSHQFGLRFDPSGRARAIYLTEDAREAGPAPPIEDAPKTEMEAFRRALVRTGTEADRRGTQELGVRYARLYGIEGLEVYNPGLGLSACFAFDRTGRLWGLWHGHEVTVAHGAWLKKAITRMKENGTL